MVVQEKTSYWYRNFTLQCIVQGLYMQHTPTEINIGKKETSNKEEKEDSDKKRGTQIGITYQSQVCS
jgi:hypothetical protein